MTTNEKIGLGILAGLLLLAWVKRGSAASPAASAAGDPSAAAPQPQPATNVSATDSQGVPVDLTPIPYDVIFDPLGNEPSTVGCNFWAGLDYDAAAFYGETTSREGAGCEIV